MGVSLVSDQEIALRITREAHTATDAFKMARAYLDTLAMLRHERKQREQFERAADEGWALVAAVRDELRQKVVSSEQPATVWVVNFSPLPGVRETARVFDDGQEAWDFFTNLHGATTAHIEQVPFNRVEPS